MPYENYLNEQDFWDNCYLSGWVQNYLNKSYSQNPWIFVWGGRPTPHEKRFFFVFRNFDHSKELTLSVDASDMTPRIENECIKDSHPAPDLNQ